jgi:hypothetical protein
MGGSGGIESGYSDVFRGGEGMRRRQANKIMKRYWASSLPFSFFRWKKKTFYRAIAIAQTFRILRATRKRKVEI